MLKAGIELIAFIEGTFPFEIPEDLLISGEFTTIDGIAAAVARRLGEPQACAVPSRERR